MSVDLFNFVEMMKDVREEGYCLARKYFKSLVTSLRKMLSLEQMRL